jgi:hypothetical protein
VGRAPSDVSKIEITYTHRRGLALVWLCSLPITTIGTGAKGGVVEPLSIEILVDKRVTAAITGSPPDDKK